MQDNGSQWLMRKYHVSDRERCRGLFLTNTGKPWIRTPNLILTIKMGFFK